LSLLSLMLSTISLSRSYDLLSSSLIVRSQLEIRTKACMGISNLYAHTFTEFTHFSACCPLQPLISCWNQKMGWLFHIYSSRLSDIFLISLRDIKLALQLFPCKRADSKLILPIACEHLTLVDEILCKSISSEKQKQVQPSSEQKSDCS
jgi:hypothetical protein